MKYPIESQYKALADATFEAVFISEKGICVDTNSSASEMFGYTREEIIGIFGTDVIADESKELVQKNMLSGLEEPYEVIAQRKDGSKFHALIRGKMIDFEGRKARVTVVRDIEKQKIAENLLRESESRLKLATAVGEVGVWDWNLVTDELIWGDSLYALYGISAEDFSGVYEAWTSTVHPDDLQFADGEIQAAIRGEREYAPDFRIVRPDGTIRIMRAASRTIRDQHGKAVRMIGTNIDITEQKRAEEEREKLIENLQSALAEVNTLKGIIPICSYCKKIRDDSGYWDQVEAYISRHPDAQFSHGVCPDCLPRAYEEAGLDPSEKDEN